jgi:hypothetical protein
MPQAPSKLSATSARCRPWPSRSSAERLLLRSVRQPWPLPLPRRRRAVASTGWEVSRRHSDPLIVMFDVAGLPSTWPLVRTGPTEIASSWRPTFRQYLSWFHVIAPRYGTWMWIRWWRHVARPPSSRAARVISDGTQGRKRDTYRCDDQPAAVGARRRAHAAGQRMVLRPTPS